MNNSKSSELYPLIKWAGGKRQLIKAIASKYPLEINKYAEPFVGGGAVLFDILNKYTPRSVYISDINPWLINMYKAVRDCPDCLIRKLTTLESEFLPLNNDDRKKMYYTVRNRYNDIIKKELNGINAEAASLFVFLNRTCFNGLYRVNRQGLYNVPMGNYKKPKICDVSAIGAASKALHNVEIRCADFEACADFVDSETFVYFDPPYRPLTSTASFTSYTDTGFDDKEQVRLAQFVTKLSDKGAHVIVSNSDPNDLFFDQLYANHHINRIKANRIINCDATKRGSVSELLISTF